MRLLHGDCLEQLRGLDDASIDAVVTDPPYGIGFMGHEWDQPGDFGPVRANGEPGLDDRVAPARRRRSQPSPASGAGHARERARFGGPSGRDNTTHTDRGGAMHAGRYDLSPSANQRFQAWVEAWASECLRVLKPGGHLLAFGGTRTHHRLAAGIEDAGFEIRDELAWLFGSGFPKSLDVSKAIDARAGAERAVVGVEQIRGVLPRSDNAVRELTAPATDDARRWQGWGTALKPAFEPVVVARKPLAGTVAQNVLEHGTGALNIDGCRIPGENPAIARRAGKAPEREAGTWANDRRSAETFAAEHPGEQIGRWPANVLLDEDAATLLDEQTDGRTFAGHFPASRQPSTFGRLEMTGLDARVTDGGGGASRFFYVAKASRAERNAGLDGFAQIETHRYGAGIGGSETSRHVGSPDRNIHPTVKPIAVMRWLVRLVTPPGGTVLDPFLGSGTTATTSRSPRRGSGTGLSTVSRRSNGCRRPSARQLIVTGSPTWGRRRCLTFRRRRRDRVEGVAAGVAGEAGEAAEGGAAGGVVG